MTPPQSLAFFGFLSAIITGLWLTLVILFADRVVWKNSLLLLPFFVLTGLVTATAVFVQTISSLVHSLYWIPDNEITTDAKTKILKSVARKSKKVKVLLWVIALLAFLGLAPLAIYTLRLVSASTDATSPVWRSEAVLSTVVATLLGCTSLLQIGILVYSLYLTHWFDVGIF